MESMGTGDDLPHSAAMPIPTAGAGQASASADSPLIKLLHVARTVNDSPQTGIDTKFRLAAHRVSNKGGLLAYVSQLICWDLDDRVLPHQSCVVAAALIDDHGLRFVIGVNAHDDLPVLQDAILKNLPRVIAGIPADHVIEKYCPAPGNCSSFSLHTEQQIAAYVRAVYGRAARKTMGAIGIAHAHDPRTPLMTAAGGNDGYAHFARKCLEAIKGAAHTDLNIQPFWYRHGQRPPRALCSPEYLIQAGIEYQRDG